MMELPVTGNGRGKEWPEKGWPGWSETVWPCDPVRPGGGQEDVIQAGQDQLCPAL